MSALHALKRAFLDTPLRSHLVAFKRLFVNSTNLAERNFNLALAQYLSRQSNPALHLGCGAQVLDAWFNTDAAFHRPEGVHYLDAAKPFPVGDATFGWVFSEHMIEHLSPEQGMLMLGECFRILKPGGRIRIATPNQDFLWQLYRSPELPLHLNYLHWAAQQFLPHVDARSINARALAAEVVNNFFRNWGHQLLYNKDLLQIRLLQAGFMNVQTFDVGDSNDPMLRGLERHQQVIPESFNKLETMVLEASKPVL